jgi:dTDP-4-dehydrorhamnose reductase
MRIVVTGRQGQLVQSLHEVAPDHACEVVALGRPEFDMTQIESIGPQIARAKPDVIVNAAAFTAVDKAESERDTALLVNGAAAGAIASAAQRIGCPVIQISTDFVFDGSLSRPYREEDVTSPLSVYGASKLLGEQLVQKSAPRHLILRTAWLISPYGHNFAKTMLRLGKERDALTIVDDQQGSPTYAPHLADAVVSLCAIMAKAPEHDPRWGIYHVTNAGATTWCGLARAIFVEARRHGLQGPAITAIPTSAYPTPARRPANSRLDGAKLSRTFGLTLPPWQDGVHETVDRLLGSG